MLCVSAEAENINQFHSLLFDPTEAWTHIDYTRGEHANHYTTDAVYNYDKVQFY